MTWKRGLSRASSSRDCAASRAVRRSVPRGGGAVKAVGRLAEVEDLFIGAPFWSLAGEVG